MGTIRIAYAGPSGQRVAYHVIDGRGPDVVLVPYGISNLDTDMDIESVRDFELRLASFCRVVRLDLRGSGLSDGLPAMRRVHTIEDAVADITTVLGAINSDRAVLFAWDAGGATAIHAASQLGSRVSGLILMHAFARARWAPDYPAGLEPAAEQAFLDLVEKHWGTGAVLRHMNPSVDPRTDPRFLGPRAERVDASGDRALAVIKSHLEIDVRGDLPRVRAPVLLLHRKHNSFIAIEHSRYLQDRLPCASLVELGGDSTMPFLGDVGAVLDHVARFLASLG